MANPKNPPDNQPETKRMRFESDRDVPGKPQQSEEKQPQGGQQPQGGGQQPPQGEGGGAP